MKKARKRLSALDRGIKLLEQGRGVFEIKIPAREAKRLLASFKKLATRIDRKRRA